MTIRVAVIGAGASGTLLALHWRAIAPPDAEIALVEAGARAARGLAYGTPYGAHLLNVPAARMSALDDDPDHFLSWLRTRMPDAHAGTFAPRTLYGEYLAGLLEAGHTTNIVRVNGTAVGLTRDGAGWVVHLHDSRTVHAHAVVLALGNLPPADPLKDCDLGPPHYLRDPWAPGAAINLDRQAPVLLIGTGLTMIDIALSLRAEGHRGPIHALSRHGRLPYPHAASTARRMDVPAGVRSPSQVMRWVRGEGEWRSVVDGLRPLTAAIWQRWSLAERGSFLRHAKNAWDVARHRTAPEVAERIDGLRSEGTLLVHAGRVIDMQASGDAVRVTWRPRGSERHESLDAGRVLNCTGPAADYARVDLPLVVEMRRAGWLTPDRHGLGIETDAGGALLDAAGKRIDGLFTLGPLRRPAVWESTAIPEIRAQAAALAKALLERTSGA